VAAGVESGGQEIFKWGKKLIFAGLARTPWTMGFISRSGTGPWGPLGIDLPFTSFAFIYFLCFKFRPIFSTFSIKSIYINIVKIPITSSLNNNVLF
jgi:hypothetical protein